MIVKLHIAVLPEVSVAVHVTVVVPIGKLDPEGGLHAVVTPGQLSVAVGVKVTVWVVVSGQVGFAVTMMLAGQVIAGGWVSLTVTMKEHMLPDCAAQVTVVAPFGKNEPLTGVHVTGPQSPFEPGAG